MPALRCRGFNVWSRLNRALLWKLENWSALPHSSPILSTVHGFVHEHYCRTPSYSPKGWADQLDTPVSLIKWSPEFSRQLLPTSSRRAKYWRNSKTGFCLSIDSSRLTWKHHLQSVNCSTSVCLSYNINYHAGLCYFACSEDQTVVGSAKGQHMLSSYTCHNSFKSQFFLFSHRTVHVLRLINKLHW